jgi:hypothetical protein
MDMLEGWALAEEVDFVERIGRCDTASSYLSLSSLPRLRRPVLYAHLITRSSTVEDSYSMILSTIPAIC